MTTLSPLLGCAVADALGKPFETKSPSHRALQEWDQVSYLPGDYPNLPGPYYNTDELLNRPGVPTDDTQMSRVLARSLVSGTSALQGYMEWMEGKSFAGAPRGIGGTIRRSLTAHSKGEVPPNCDPSLPCGTGAAMRAGVLGMIERPFLDIPFNEIVEAAKVDAAFTHPGHPEADVTAAVMAAAVAYAKDHVLSGSHAGSWDLVGFLTRRFGQRNSHSATMWALRLVDHLRYGFSFKDCALLPDDGVGITATAILCAATADSYKSGVLTAIRMGGDTDTRAAMAGTILGTRFGIGGLRGIPEVWVSGLYEAEEIQSEDRLLNSRSIRPCEGSRA